MTVFSVIKCNSLPSQSDLSVRKCHAMLFVRNLYELKMAVVILTAEIGIRKHMMCVILPKRGVSALYHKSICSFIHSFNAIKCICIVFLLSIAGLMRLDHLETAFGTGSSTEKALDQRLFTNLL